MSLAALSKVVAVLALTAAPDNRMVQPLPSLAPLVESVKGAVVNVDVQSRVRMPQGQQFDFFSPFMDPRMMGRGRQAPVRQGTGSGFIISPDGKILTNNHVVDGADRIRVRLDDGRAFEAEVLGHDPLTDLALIKIKGKVSNLPVVALGNSDAMKVGDWVVAIGNPFGLASSVSAGIISAVARDIGAGPYDDFLQTDAAINPGNSGGPLFNLNGEVIGINSAIIERSSGIGFAVPSSVAKALLPQLERGKIERGWLGVAIQDLTPELAKGLKTPAAHGALVAQVTEGTPASRAGLQPEDIVVAVDGREIDSSKALTRGVGFRAPGTTIKLTLYRQGSKLEVPIKLGERPDPNAPQVEPAVSSGDQSSEELGLNFQDGANANGQRVPGAMITQVEPGSAAEQAALEPGMVITQAGNRNIRSARDLARVLKNAPHGSTVIVRVEQDGQQSLRALPVP